MAVDPAADRFKLRPFQDGLSNVMNASNEVVPGFYTVAPLLATGRLVVSSSCRRLIECLPGYSWDPKNTAKGEDAPA